MYLRVLFKPPFSSLLDLTSHLVEQSMTKIDVVDKIYEKVGFPKSEVAKIVDAVFDMIKDTLKREDKLVVSGFGNFVIRKKRARRGRNPQTGGRIEITSRRVLTFKPSPVLKARLNHPANQ
jgi:integration host factor subunit alpha